MTNEIFEQIYKTTSLAEKLSEDLENLEDRINSIEGWIQQYEDSHNKQEDE